MTWLQRYRFRHYVQTSIWIPPVLSTLAAIAAVRLLYWVQQDVGWESPVTADTARAVLGTMAASLFTAIVFVCTALLVAVQLVSAALTPRIIAIVFRDPITKFALTLLVFVFTFSLSALIRISSIVPLLTTHVAAYSCVVCLAVFFFLIDHLGRALRPSGALRAVAWLGRRVIEGVYPQRLVDLQAGTAPEAVRALDGESTATIYNPTDGVVLAFDEKGLLNLARRADCMIEMVPQVGDHVAAGDPLFRIYQGGTTIPAEALCQSVAVGQ
ncbi:MAG TPA: DUF2254 family protein, partial [Gemmataceae bacterium]|nr:DUF2254 family protein [Gemmataceae bacterium]